MNDTITNKSSKGQRGRPKDPQKAEQILKAATQLFMDKGLKHTSMDAVAKQAGVSKQTLYSHFKDKDDLFRAVIRSKMETYHITGRPLKFSGDLETDLNVLGYHLLDLILDDEAIALYRTVIAEGQKYQQTAQLFYDQGPDTVLKQLTNFLANQDISDAEFFAISFLNMLDREWQTKALIGLINKPMQDEMKEHVSRVVKVFIRMINK